HVLHEQGDIGDGKLRAGQPAQRTAGDQRQKLHPARTDTARLECGRIFACGTDAQPQTMAGEEEMQRRYGKQRHIEEDRLSAKDGADDRYGGEAGDLDGAETDDPRIIEGAGDVEDSPQEEGRYASRQYVDRDRDH